DQVAVTAFHGAPPAVRYVGRRTRSTGLGSSPWKTSLHRRDVAVTLGVYATLEGIRTRRRHARADVWVKIRGVVQGWAANSHSSRSRSCSTRADDPVSSRAKSVRSAHRARSVRRALRVSGRAGLHIVATRRYPLTLTMRSGVRGTHQSIFTDRTTIICSTATDMC